MNSMEKQKGSITSSGYNVSDKKSSSNNSDFNAVVSSMKQNHSDITEPLLFTSKMATQNDLDRPFGGGGGGDGDGGGDERVGSTSCTDGGANDVVMSSTYSRENVSMYPYNVHGENIGASTSTNLQPFDIFASYPNNPYYKSPGGMNGSVGVSFTPAQWKELERQAMIYKYMISAVPVPNDLLFPLSRPFSADPSLYNVRYTKSGDPEPGRCKRTDGKKWRCSRDVAPHQKYCERHLHRGRPRSRKPVEITKNNNNGNNGSIENKKKTRVEIPKANTSQQFVPAAASEPLLLFNAKSDLSVSTNRDLSLMMDAENRWHNLFEPSMGFSNQGSSIYGSNSPIFHQDYIQNQPSLNVFSYPNYPTASEIEAPIGFIDAWSMDNLNTTNNGDHPKSSVSPNDENLSTSLNLSMAMAAGNVLDEQMGNIQMGNNDNHKISDYHHDHHNTTKDSRWLCPVSWAGGPLAEALHPGSAIVGPTNPGPHSPRESISNTATTVSSPSGVIQRTLFSNSDGSVCNSPTVPSEALFQWLN